jgi:hypothetical protein
VLDYFQPAIHFRKLLAGKFLVKDEDAERRQVFALLAGFVETRKMKKRSIDTLCASWAGLANTRG